MYRMNGLCFVDALSTCGHDSVRNCRQMASGMAKEQLDLVCLYHCVFTERKAVLFNIYVEYYDKV